MTTQGFTPASHDEDGPETTPNSRRDLMKKLAVGGAIVWAAPAIASSAGAQALGSEIDSPGVPGGTPQSGTYTVGGNGGTRGGVAVTSSPSVPDNAGGGTLLTPNNRTLVGGTPPRSALLEMAPIGTAPGSYARQTYTVSFSSPVTNVSFAVTGVGGIEQFGIASVNGGGTLTIPSTGGTRSTSTDGGPITSFVIQYRVNNATQTAQSVTVGPITYTV